MSKRSNWKDFEEVLSQNRITKLYHFTERDNLESIIRNGGLYSWKDCEERGIPIPKPSGGGAGSTSWSLDQRKGLERYVRVSFTTQHPMMFVAMNENRISNPVILEIDPEVIYDDETKYSDRNATRSGAQVGDSLDDFKNIHYSTVKARNHFDLDADEQQFYQAEVMVKNFIPLKYITNIANFGIPIPSQPQIMQSKNAYTARVDREHPTAFIFLVDQSVSKLNDTLPNEDSFWRSENLIAVSDGAGGCGLFAGEWSEYLLRHIPRKRAITSFREFDAWVDGIWEAFYDKYEGVAKAGDGIFLNKFYNEGSCATVAAVWRVGVNECRWIAYGDSVVFSYDVKTGTLEHSFTRLADFNRPPMLVSCKDPLVEEGFRCGDFKIDEDSVVFVASDALSHYVLMMYELANCGRYWDELEEESRLQSSNSLLLHTAETMKFDFWKDVLSPLRESAGKPSAFKSHICSLLDRGLLDLDDTTIVFLY